MNPLYNILNQADLDVIQIKFALFVSPTQTDLHVQPEPILILIIILCMMMSMLLFDGKIMSKFPNNQNSDRKKQHSQLCLF